MSPSSPLIGRRQLLIRTATVAGGFTLASTMNMSLAEAAPAVHTRADWRARPPRSTAQVLNRRPDHIVVHQTESANSTDYSLAHAFGLSRSIQNYHMDSNGWSDIGQQLTISRGGHILEGRNRSLSAINAGKHVVGAHTANHNSHTIGIENEGKYFTVTPPEKLWASLVETCRWLCDMYRLDPHAAIVGHRDYNDTDCPGDRLYGLLPKLRDEVAAAMGLPVYEGPGFYVRTRRPRSGRRFDHGPAVGSMDPRP